MKRFTETNKWQDAWFRKLSAVAKLLWIYAIDRCDCVGVVEIDCEIASEDFRVKVTEKHIQELSGRIQHIDGIKFFIPKFIDFQYGKLSPACPAHKKVLQAVDDIGLVRVGLGYQYPNARVTEGYQYPSDTLQDKDRKKNGEEEGLIQEEATPVSKKSANARGTFDEMKSFFAEIGLTAQDAEYAFTHWEENGWTRNGKPIKDWRMTARSWKAAGYFPSQKGGRQQANGSAHRAEKAAKEYSDQIDISSLIIK